MIITKQSVALGIPAISIFVTMLVIFFSLVLADDSDAEKSKTAVFHAKNSIWVMFASAILLLVAYLAKDRDF